jgi:hypothetical protein
MNSLWSALEAFFVLMELLHRNLLSSYVFYVCSSPDTITVIDPTDTSWANMMKSVSIGVHFAFGYWRHININVAVMKSYKMTQYSSFKCDVAICILRTRFFWVFIYEYRNSNRAQSMCETIPTYQATRQSNHSSTRELRHPHALLLHQTKAELTSTDHKGRQPSSEALVSQWHLTTGTTTECIHHVWGTRILRPTDASIHTWQSSRASILPICSADGDCNVYRKVGATPTHDAAEPRKHKLRIRFKLRKLKDENEGS